MQQGLDEERREAEVGRQCTNCCSSRCSRWSCCSLTLSKELGELKEPDPKGHKMSEKENLHYSYVSGCMTEKKK